MYEVDATFQAVSHTDLVHLRSPSSQSYRLWQTLGAGHLLSSFSAVPGAACVAVPMDVKYRRKPIASSSYYIPGPQTCHEHSAMVTIAYNCLSSYISNLGVMKCNATMLIHSFSWEQNKCCTMPYAQRQSAGS